MATSALRKLHIAPGTPPPADEPPIARLTASATLPEWLALGGPDPVKQPRAHDAPPLVHLSTAFALGGTESNIKVIAKRTVEAGHFIAGVALSSVLHPRSPAVTPERQAKCAQLASQVRSWRTGGEGLLGEADDAYRIDLILLLAMELLDGSKSKWSPYLASLPKTEDAAPPSLWPYLPPSVTHGHDALLSTAVLRDTSVGAQVLTDAIELAPFFATLRGPKGLTEAAANGVTADMLAKGTEVLEGVASCSAGGGCTVSMAREALLRSIALVSSRMISGVGLVPLLDLCNGAVSGGGHNAAIERTQLAVSNEAPEAAKCAAALSTSRIEEGEEVLLGYGSFSAAKFLYTYGYVGGGGEAASAATSPHDAAYVIPRDLWPTLSGSQRTVLAKYGINPRKLGVNDEESGNDAAGDNAPPQAPMVSPFKLPVLEASAGKTTPMMRQVGLISSITEESTLEEIARTGKLGTSHGIGPSEIGKQIVLWCASHVTRSAMTSTSAEVLSLAQASSHARMALRVAHGERGSVVKWMEALAAKHELVAATTPKGKKELAVGVTQDMLLAMGGGDKEVGERISEAQSKQKVAMKKLKQAVKESAEPPKPPAKKAVEVESEVVDVD